MQTRYERYFLRKLSSCVGRQGSESESKTSKMLRLTRDTFLFLALSAIAAATPLQRATFEENAAKLSELLRKGNLTSGYFDLIHKKSI